MILPQCRYSTWGLKYQNQILLLGIQLLHRFIHLALMVATDYLFEKTHFTLQHPALLLLLQPFTHL